MLEVQNGVGAGRDDRQGEVGINVGAARRPSRARADVQA
jgi:hypothetical protein